VAGSTAEAQEADAGGRADWRIIWRRLIRNAVNLPALSADQYRRVRPYLALAEAGTLVSQAVAVRPARIALATRASGVVGTHLLRSGARWNAERGADEKQRVNAPAIAAARDFPWKRRRGGVSAAPNTLEVVALPENSGWRKAFPQRAPFCTMARRACCR
jgi:hypothetical protein